MRKLLYVLLSVISLSVTHVHAQNTSPDPRSELYNWSQKKYTFTVQPFQLFNSGLKIDFEVRLGNGPGWLQFSPAVYYSTKNLTETDFYFHRSYYDDRWGFNIFSEPYTKMKGGGLDINYKRFLDPRRSFYTAAGITFTRYDIEYWGWASNDYIEDGLTYRSYMYDIQTQRINRAGINYYFGYQIPAHRSFIYDMFWGLSYRHSFSDENKPSFNDNMFSQGYSGFVFIAGLRLGFGIR